MLYGSTSKKTKKTYENGTLGGKDQKEERRKKKMTPRDPLRDLKMYWVCLDSMTFGVVCDMNSGPYEGPN